MLNKGMFIDDRYEIDSKIGSGGMSNVYKAKDQTLGRYVAIKVLKSEFCEDMNFVSKFRAEAQAAAGLEHPNIVNIYDVGNQDGFYYIVMEYVEGITLKTYIEKKGQLNYKETLSIAIQVGRGIQAAHAKNIIHRDIKPQNIMISRDGKVKVTDFGIARAVSENTIHSDVMGSVHYSSPEQARNGYVSNRSDIYSLGIVMYEMVTGRVPFDGESTVAVAIKHLQDEMVAPSEYAPDLPISLEKIILKCTQKSADRRYDSMESLLVDLRKSLLSPNDDFVTLVPYNQDKTRVITNDEVKQIQEQAVKTEPMREEIRPILPREEEMFEEEDEDDEEEGFFNPKMEKIFNVLRIVVVIVIVLIVIYIVGSLLGLIHFDGFKIGGRDSQTQISEENGETAVMIDLKGMTVEEASEELGDVGITVKIKATEPSDTYEEGQIIDQDIQPGDTAEAGSTVNVTVSSGTGQAQEIPVPDLSGKSSDEALEILKSAGFIGAREFEYNSSIPVGDVITQTPDAGTMAESGSLVTIYVSQGTESSQVPAVEGHTEEEARKALGDAGFNIGDVSESYSDTVPAGQVISQSLSAGKYAEKGTAVDLVVSKGQKAKTYYSRAKVTTPSNVTVKYADIVLYKAESDEMVESWTNVTEFPFVAEAHGIEGADKGVLVITWYYTDAEGNDNSYDQEASVTFHEE